MIFRVNKTKGFSVMSNYHLQDKNLSLRAKGLLSLMLSLPDDWKFSIAGLASLCIEKEQAVKSSLDELKAEGYVVVTKLLPNQTESKRIEWLYDIYEKPQTEDLEKEQSPVEQPPVEQGVATQGVVEQGIETQGIENQPLQNTKVLSTKEQNTKKEVSKKVSSGNNARAKEKSFDEILDSVEVIKENPELREAFVNFIKMRKVIKAQLTNRGLELAINRAYELAKGNPQKMIAVVNQSVERSWRGIFELTENKVEPKTHEQLAKEAEKERSENPYYKRLEEKGII